MLRCDAHNSLIVTPPAVVGGISCFVSTSLRAAALVAGRSLLCVYSTIPTFTAMFEVEKVD